MRGWQAELARVLDERHMAAWSGSAAQRASFASSLASFLAGIDQAQTIPLYGRDITDLDGFCYQLERSIPGDTPLRRRIDGPSGVVARLRSQPTVPGRPPLRMRYILWNDPDVLIRADDALFGRLADAIAGVAAEAEFASDDYLLITRVVYIGGEALRQYAELDEGQLRSWLGDGAGEPFWRTVSGVQAPPVIAGSIESLLEDPESIAHEALMASIQALIV